MPNAYAAIKVLAGRRSTGTRVIVWCIGEEDISKLTSDLQDIQPTTMAKVALELPLESMHVTRITISAATTFQQIVMREYGTIVPTQDDTYEKAMLLAFARVLSTEMAQHPHSVAIELVGGD